LVGGVAWAQQPAATSTGAQAPAVELSVKQKAELTPQETVAQARDYQQQMATVIHGIQGLQETARRQKDIIKLNCVTDKLIQAKVNANIADQASASLQDNVARGDDAGRQHEFTRLTILNQKVQVLRTEAENCIGEDLSFVGAARVDVETDPSIPRLDPTIAPTPILTPERPGTRLPEPSSTFQ
jgi:hypothetical protein